jgi:hypothetical protein
MLTHVDLPAHRERRGRDLYRIDLRYTIRPAAHPIALLDGLTSRILSETSCDVATNVRTGTANLIGICRVRALRYLISLEMFDETRPRHSCTVSNNPAVVVAAVELVPSIRPVRLSRDGISTLAFGERTFVTMQHAARLDRRV